MGRKTDGNRIEEIDRYVEEHPRSKPIEIARELELHPSTVMRSLPALEEAGCAVDWSWIAGSLLRGARLAAGRLQLELDPAGPLTVSAALWQGRPFLAFQPYRPRA